MNTRILPLIYLFFFTLTTQAQKGYDISVQMKLDGNQTLYLAYHLGSKQYVAAEDSSSNGEFNFRGDEKLERGIYKLVIKENMQVLEIVSINDDQHFELITTTPQNFVKDMMVKGSEENEHYYALAKEKYKLLTSYRAIESKTASVKGTVKKDLENQLTNLTQKAQELQKEFIENHPNFLISKALKANIPVEIPTAKELGLTPQEYESKRLELFRKHFFDNFDLNEDGLIRTDIFYPLINSYLNNLYYQDSTQQKKGLTKLLNTLAINPEMYKLTLIEMVNKFATVRSFHGVAIYAFLVEEYYLKGKAEWIDAPTLQSMRKSVEKIRSTELGKTAPAILLLNDKGEEIAIKNITAKYKILVFWNANKESSLTPLLELQQITAHIPSSELQILAIDKGENKNLFFQKVQAHHLSKPDNWINAFGQPYQGKDFSENYRNYGEFYYILLDADNTIIMRGNAVEKLANSL